MEKSYLPILSLAYVFTVPVLVALTDRVDPKRIYLLGVTTIAVVGLGYAWLADGFWSALFFCSFWGVGWAGTYMPGLKVLSDPIEGPQQSCAAAVHAASVGIRSSASFILNGGCSTSSARTLRRGGAWRSWRRWGFWRFDLWRSLS